MKCRQCKLKIKEDDKFYTIPLGAIHNDCIDEYCKKVKKTARQKTKKISDLELTQRAFNKFIRLRDTKGGKGYCISCGAVLLYGTQNCQAGHYKSVGSRSDLRFNEDNCHIQCLKCNKFGERDVWITYKDNLIKKIGQQKVDLLEVRTKQDYSKENLKKIRSKYQKKCLTI